MFSRALRLRWLWYEWTDRDRPWIGGQIPVNEVGKQLFRACTKVHIGNGAKAKFWESCWLDGKAPRDVAPSLYKLAWRKNLTVKEQMINQSWTRGLWHMEHRVPATRARGGAKLVEWRGKAARLQGNGSGGTHRSSWLMESWRMRWTPRHAAAFSRRLRSSARGRRRTPPFR